MPEQLSLFGNWEESRKVVEPPEDIVSRWIEDRAPLIHVSGKNLCRVTTFRSTDTERWVYREWVDEQLEKNRYFWTHTLTTPICGEDWIFDVFRPWPRKVL